MIQFFFLVAYPRVWANGRIGVCLLYSQMKTLPPEGRESRNVMKPCQCNNRILSAWKWKSFLLRKWNIGPKIPWASHNVHRSPLKDLIHPRKPHERLQGERMKYLQPKMGKKESGDENKFFWTMEYCFLFFSKFDKKYEIGKCTLK